MPRPHTPATSIQLDLFHQPPATPAWHQLPTEVRARTRILPARLLVAPPQARRDAAGDEEEVRDE